METQAQAAIKQPTSGMPLDDIIRELVARRGRAQEAMIRLIAEGIRQGHLVIDRTDTDWEILGVYLSKHFELDSTDPFIERRMEIGSEYDNARDALETAFKLRRALEGGE